MRFLIIGASVICAALIGLAIFLSVNSGSKSRIIELHPSALAREKVGGWISGSESDNPEVTVVEYADMQCPGCAALYPIIQDVLNVTGSYTQFQFHHYLIPGHNKARLGAQAVEAAGRQGKSKEMIGYLFSTQNSWSQDTTFAFKDMVIAYAESLGLHKDQFRNDLNDSQVNELIDSSVRVADAIPITQTPTLIINGVVLPKLPRSADQLTALIVAARSGEDSLRQAIEALKTTLDGTDQAAIPASNTTP